MSMRSILLVVAALLMIGGTIFVARGWLESQRNQITTQPAPVEKIKSPHVLVAAQDLPLGSFIGEGDLRWQAWPNETLPDSYLLEDQVQEEDYYGTVIRHSFSAGQPITVDRLIKPGDRGFLAAVLQAGYRAVSIPISATSGIAGLIFPGDRVDIILTLALEEDEDESGKKDEDKDEMRASETILTNVRILALDQKVSDQNGEPKLAKTATLEVLPKQAEILAVAREMGSLSLALRSLAKDEEELRRIALSDEPLEEPVPEKGLTYTWDSEASLLVKRREIGAGESTAVVITVARGKEVQALSFGR